MNKKYPAIDLISYFFKFLVLILIGVLVFFGIKEIYELFYLLFTNLERKLCIYESIIKENNIVSDFLILHGYKVIGSNAYTFLDGSINIFNITLFLRIYEILKYIYFIIIGLLGFNLLNNYSKNNVYNNKVNSKLLIISILIFIIPFFNLLRDYIGCLIINTYNIKEPIITFDNLKINYFIIGLLLFGIYFYNYLTINNKTLKGYYIYKKITSSIFILTFTFLSILSIYNLITVIISDKSQLEYYELTKVYDPFLNILVNNSFNIFGESWTYLGLQTNLKASMIIYYLSQILINFSFLFVFILELKNNIKNEFNFSRLLRNLLIFILIIIGTFLLEMISMGIVISNYKSYQYYNKNLEYSLINFSHLYYLFLMIFTFVTSFSLKRK